MATGASDLVGLSRGAAPARVAPAPERAPAIDPFAPTTSRAGRNAGPDVPLSLTAKLMLIAAVLAVAFPTMRVVARESWATEQGAHGPLVLLTGLWLLFRAWRHVGPIAPPPLWRPVVLFVPLLALYVVARISQVVEVEGYVMYALLLTFAYALVGGAVLRRLAFPIAYLAFLFPPPDTVVWSLTLPMKIAVTEAAVWLLHLFDYPIGYSGVWIQVGQYQLLVAAACSGLNSIISLSVLSVFYIYIRRAGDPIRAAALALLIVPVAMAANVVRVLILILLTYHYGEATAQGFMHNFAGFTMFIAALMILFAVDLAMGPVTRRLRSRLPEPETAR